MTGTDKKSFFYHEQSALIAIGVRVQSDWLNNYKNFANIVI